MVKTKKPKGGVDFKKYKHKLGRKLPPPQNATNPEIKSKAIILPEQSLASDRSGLTVDKGLTLKELLQKTSHHNAKIRKAALPGAEDLLLKYPLELTLHKLAVIEKLRERICDNDKVVREKLYDILRTVIFNHLKEVQCQLCCINVTSEQNVSDPCSSSGRCRRSCDIGSSSGSRDTGSDNHVYQECLKRPSLVILIVTASVPKMPWGTMTPVHWTFLDELDQTSS